MNIVAVQIHIFFSLMRLTVTTLTIGDSANEGLPQFRKLFTLIPCMPKKTLEVNSIAI